jgi:hypothetical protein
MAPPQAMGQGQCNLVDQSPKQGQMLVRNFEKLGSDMSHTKVVGSTIYFYFNLYFGTLSFFTTALQKLQCFLYLKNNI